MNPTGCTALWSLMEDGALRETEFFVDNLLVRNHFIIVMVRWTGLASLNSLVQVALHLPSRKVDVKLPGKGNSNSHGARPVQLIITMIKWIRTSGLLIKNSLSARPLILELSALNMVVVGQVEAPKKVEAPKVLFPALIEQTRHT